MFLRLVSVLTDELCALQCVREAQQRSVYTTLVCDSLGMQWWERGIPVRGEMAAFVRQVLQHRGGQGYGALIEAVAVLEGRETADALDRLVRREVYGVESRAAVDLPGVFDGDTQRRAWDLLAHGSVPRPVLHSVLSRELRIALPDGEGALGLFVHLVEQNAQPDGLPPALVLVEVVAALGSPQAAALRAWSDEWAASAGLTDALRERRAQTALHATPDGTVPRALVVMVDPAHDGTDRIYVRHWVNAAAGFWQPRAFAPEETTLDRLGPAVLRAVRHGEAQWAGGAEDSPVHVEFVLPHALLNHDVAQLKLTSDAFEPLPLHLRFYVHLRSLDRMRVRDAQQRRLWHDRWRTLQEAPAAETVRWSGTTDPLAQWQEKLHRNPRATGVILQHPAEHGHGLEALVAALTEGVGLVVWDRRPDMPQSVELLRLLLGHSPSQLPFKVHQLRVRAETEEGGRLLVGRSIAFLWDDPNRVVDCEEMPA
ncbi:MULTISPECIES: hypothetical protein [unclassified Streptomyces]|uniref:VMAP-C domain-containing protein n=1 Tax=unclassified Streptomyces TaxID=2593676 RepID=UPI000DB95C21|nr:hypothetical protein [Streptomyces sp. PsTaAH-137]MYT74431.1 hypothetical protein [Streptomyces sp. SID8367]RAJ91409.1 hypothetical protein K377_00174 [Streptomyces sp. PsTaAH-137]